MDEGSKSDNDDSVAESPIKMERESSREERSASDTESKSPAQEKSRIMSNKSSTPEVSSTNAASDRLARFKALQTRARSSIKSNRAAAAAEERRLAINPGIIASLSRKQAIASHELLKSDIEASGEDFERKRAWDWTIEESEKWDKRMEKKARHREEVAFQDYRQEAAKVYKRQVKEMKPDMEGYEKAKRKALEKAAVEGGLDIVETQDGELVAIDQNGTFYTTEDNTNFVENKPDRAAVDKLVNELKKQDEIRLKKRRARGREEEGDVTYINEKNKQFNMKLARFYNKYTTDIRESFERGTMI